MMRRSRISVRPNVKPTGRAPVASQDNVQPPRGPVDSAPSERSEVMAEKLALGRSNEEASQSSSSNNQSEAISHGADVGSKNSDAQDSASTSVTSGPQRRKRFTALPNLAKPRASPASTRTPKSPSKSPVKPATLSKTDTSTPTAETSLQRPEPGHNSSAPGIWRPPGGRRQAKAQPIPEAPLRNDQETETQEDGGLEDTVLPLTVQQGESQRPLRTSKPDTILVHENPPECPVPPAVEDMVTQEESVSEGQSQTDLLKDRLKKLKPLKILNSLTTLNDPADMVRLAQARKLRELLKKEMNKNKQEKKKPKLGIKERKAPKDHTKMTMRELIYYLPVSNPMKSFTEEEQKASETELDDSPTPTSSKTPAVPSVQETVEEDAENEEDEERVDETQLEEEEPLVVPRVKVAEDGSLIIDEESLTVQVSRAKGPNPAEDRDPIFERGSTTTYSSFRKGTYTKPWSSGETELFFLAISMVGTDFSMIGQLFPHRSRLEIKNKFKKEERNNSWRIDKSFKQKRRLDLDFFQKLMEQVLKAEENKKNKNKELTKLAKAQSRVYRTVKAKRKRKEIDTSEDSDSDVVAGEKENEDLSNDGGSDTDSKKHRGRGANTLQRRIKRTNGEAIDEPEDYENATSDGQSQDDRLREADSSENINKSPAIKPAQLRGRSQRPNQNFSRRWGNRRPEPKSNTQEGGTSVTGEGKMDGSTKVPSELTQEDFLESEDLEEEPDLSSVHEQIFNKPTRSGRIPKLSLHVMQAAAEEEEDEEELSEPPVSSKTCNQGIKAPGRRAKLKPGPTLKQGMHRRGKSRLVTLRASGAEDDDEEDEDEDEDVEDCVLSQVDFPSCPEEENQAFVPMSLRPLLPVNSEVVETMEELDISVNVPDILGTSQNALCPEISYEQAALPARPVTYEHQLDLLADVIEFLDPDHMGECKEINNEAAQTLLTIGNSAQMTQTSEIPCTGENEILGQSSIVHEEVVHEEVITETALMSGPSVSCESELKDDVELSSCKTHNPELSAEETKEEPVKSQSTDAHLDPIQHETQDLACSNSVPPPKIGRFSKPKPNIGKGLRSRRAPQQKIYSELVTGSVESSKGPSVTEKDTNATQPMQEDSVPVVPTYPEVLQLEKSSEIREDSLNVVSKRVTEEDNGSVSSPKRKNDDKITEEKIKAQEEAGAPQLTNSVSESQSTSDEPAKPVRRSRGPKPKPNLTQTSRHTRTQTQHKTVTNEKLPAAESFTSTFTKSPDEGAVVSTESDVSQSAAQEVASSTESAQAVKDVTPPVVSEDESRKKTVVMLDENKKTSPVKVFEDSTVKHFGRESEEISAEPTPEEPLFILSLTEIPPTLDEGAGFRTEPVPLTVASELHSHGQRANESKEVSHLLITDALVPVSEDEEKKSGEGDVGKWRKGGLKRKTPASVSQGSTEGESQAEHHVELLGSPVAEGTEDEKEHLEKKRKLPERTRRAKLQVKPIPISRRNARGVDAKEDTAALSLKETTPLPISTRETRSMPEQTVPADVSTADNTTSTTISDREANTDLTATNDNSHSPQRENDPQKSFQKDPSQGIMGQVELPGKETVELASGPNSQSVSQITPIATSGSLTRPGRRPKGFLSFISSKSTQGPPTAQRGAKPVPQKPAVNTTRPERKRIAVGPVTMAKKPDVKGPSPTSASTSASVIENSEEEPTSVSKYFFSDIFTEVDELEDLD